jgi:hypothetical protein
LHAGRDPRKDRPVSEAGDRLPRRRPRRDGCRAPSAEANARLPFGRRTEDGRLVRATEVPSGRACGCACPACGTPLLARRGAVRAPHFAHDAERACAAAYETALHRLAKQLIADGHPVTLPAVVAEHAGRRRHLHPETSVRPARVTLEAGLDGLRPDILAEVRGRPLLVEVAVTHRCGPGKVDLIRGRRLAAVEIDLSRVPPDAPPEALEAAILRTAPRHWLYNRHAEAAAAALRAEASRRAAARARARALALAATGRALLAAAAAPTRPPRDPRVGWGVAAARDAGLAGLVGVALAGDGCFAVAREVWQAHLVERHVLGGRPLAQEAIPAVLRGLLRAPFAAPTPAGFVWAEITARFPELRAPEQVVQAYLRLLARVGLLYRSRDGAWRAASGAVAARLRRSAVVGRDAAGGDAATGVGPRQPALRPRRSERAAASRLDGETDAGASRGVTP